MRTVLRLTLIGLALGQGTCAHPKVQQPPATLHYLVPLTLDGRDELWVQQRDGSWSRIHLDDLRKLLGAMAKA